MSQIGELIEVVHVTLNEVGRADFVRSDNVRPNEHLIRPTPDACEPIPREERDSFLSAHGA